MCVLQARQGVMPVTGCKMRVAAKGGPSQEGQEGNSARSSAPPHTCGAHAIAAAPPRCLGQKAGAPARRLVHSLRFIRVTAAPARGSRCGSRRKTRSAVI